MTTQFIAPKSRPVDLRPSRYCIVIPQMGDAKAEPSSTNRAAKGGDRNGSGSVASVMEQR